MSEQPGPVAFVSLRSTTATGPYNGEKTLNLNCPAKADHLTRGIIDFNRFEGKDILIAHRERGGNCQTRLNLKNNNKFIERNYCFGVFENRGKYEIKGDTIYFKNKSGEFHENYYEYGIIQKFENDESKIPGKILFYYSNDTSWSNFLYLVNNE